MSTSQQVQAAWKENVWSDPRILEFTQQIWPCDVRGNQDTGCDLEKLLCHGIINFVQYTVQRHRDDDEVGGCGRYLYRVGIEYFLEDSCENQQKIQRFFEVLDDIVVERLGLYWANTVSRFERQRGFPRLQRPPAIEGRLIYSGSYEYLADKST